MLEASISIHANSIASLKKAPSFISCSENLETNVPDWGITSTKPSFLSFAKASETGERDTPKALQISCLRIISPGKKLSSIIASRMARKVLSVSDPWKLSKVRIFSFSVINFNT